MTGADAHRQRNAVRRGGIAHRGVTRAETMVCCRTKTHRVQGATALDWALNRASSPKLIAEPSIPALRGVPPVVGCSTDYAQANLLCALAESGAVYGWGDGQLGQLGTPSPTSPVTARPISELPPMIEIGSGGSLPVDAPTAEQCLAGAATE